MCRMTGKEREKEGGKLKQTGEECENILEE
jgi:hypothetical protein